MISYGGVYLSQLTPQLRAEIDRYAPLHDIYEWTFRVNPGHRSMPWTFQANDDPRPIKLNTLYFPTGAARWAVGYFLATDTMLASIRKKAYTRTSANQYVSLPLVLGEGSYKITTDMWLLPPRPIFQIDGQGQLYLLTLVDDRWWWWEKHASITVTEGTTTWATLISDIATALGVTITTDTIDSAYLKPGADFTSRYEYLPLLLDAVLSCIGHTLVRKLDGTLVTQTPTTAKTAEDAEIASWDKMGGGTFALKN